MKISPSVATSKRRIDYIEPESTKNTVVIYFPPAMCVVLWIISLEKLSVILMVICYLCFSFIGLVSYT